MNTKDTPMDYKQFEGHTPYFSLDQNEYGKKWLFYSPGTDGKYNCWEPINDAFYAEFEKLQASSKENASLKLELQKQNRRIEVYKSILDIGDNKIHEWQKWEQVKNKELASKDAELQKQKELNAELVKAAEEAMKCLRAFKEVSGLPTDDVESQNAYHKLKSLIKKSNEI